MSVCVCVYVCVLCPPPRLLITSGMMWCDMDMFYSCYMVIVVGIVNGHGLGIDMHHGNYPNKSKLVLHKALIHCNTR